MIRINDDLVSELSHALRVKSSRAEDEIRGLASACLLDLEIAGVWVTDLNDYLVRQAITLYCKAHYGYDEKVDRFELCYSALKDAMALCGDYAKVVEEHV